MQRRWVLMASLAAATVLSPTVAHAGFYQNLFRALQIAATPIGGSSGARFGNVDLERNLLGNGYRLTFDRNFGPDALGRPEVYDLGPIEMELAGNVQSTLDFTTRGFFIGSADTTFSNLSYRVAGVTGGLDAELTGVLNVANSVEVNQFGFYTISMNVANDVSTLTFDTLEGSEVEELDFDIGPINVEGNVFVDLLYLVLDGLGADVSWLEPLTTRSAVQALQDAFNDALTAAPLDGFSLGLTDDGLLVTPDATVAGLKVESTSRDAQPLGVVVPEPASVGVLLLGLAATALRRR